MHYIKKKRSSADYCNICGKYSRLTWDHVPPKAVTGKVSMNVNTLFNGIPTNQSYQREYQSGIQYRLILLQR